MISIHRRTPLGQLNYASYGRGSSSNVAMALLLYEAKLKMVPLLFLNGSRKIAALRTFFGRWQMALQIHRIMKESQDLDHVVVLSTPDAKHYKMPSLAALAGDVKRENPLEDVVPLFRTRDGRADSQIVQRRRDRFGVDARLGFAELVHRPAQDRLEVGLGGGRQADRPAARACSHFERVAGFPPIAFSAIAVK